MQVEVELVDFVSVQCHSCGYTVMFVDGDREGRTWLVCDDCSATQPLPNYFKVVRQDD